MHYHGRCEKSLWNWFLALEAAFPWLEDPNQVRIEITRLRADGIIELEKEAVGSYSGQVEHDTKLLLAGTPLALAAHSG